MAKRGRKTSKSIPPWAARIVAARNSKELGQAELGEKIGRDQRSVSGYEVGETEPDLSIYRKIADVTEVHIAWLVFGLDPAWLVFADEGRSDAPIEIPAEANENDRLFAWAFHQAVRLFAEEGLNANFAYAISFTRKLLRVPNKGADDSQSKEAILRAIEIDRVEFRKNLDEAKKKLL